MPNLLGRSLRYLTEAVKYASEPFQQQTVESPTNRKRKARLFDPMLADLARTTGRANEPADIENITTLAAVSSWVYSDLSIIASRVSDSDLFRVEKKGKPEKVTKAASSKDNWTNVPDHPFLDILSRPNPAMPGDFLMRYTMWWFYLRGNGYWFISTPSLAKPPVLELWPLPASDIDPMPETLRPSLLDPSKLVIDYEYTVNGKPYRVPGEHIVHFRTVNIFDYWRGLAPLSALRYPVELDFAESKWLTSFFGEHNAVPTAIISLDSELDDGLYEEARDAIREQFGAKKASAITRAGDMSIETISQTIAELQVLEGRKFNREEIDRIFGIPEGIFGTSISGDSRLAAEIALARNVLQPMLNYSASVIELSILPFYELERQEDVRLVASDVVPQDRALNITEYNAYGIDRTLNENRIEQDLDPIKLSGDLAELQPLVEEVPQRLVDMAFQWLMQKQQQALAEEERKRQEEAQAKAEEEYSVYDFDGEGTDNSNNQDNSDATPKESQTGLQNQDQMMSGMVGKSFDTSQPRWPKGTPKGGKWMRIGDFPQNLQKLMRNQESRPVGLIPTSESSITLLGLRKQGISVLRENSKPVVLRLGDQQFKILVSSGDADSFDDQFSPTDEESDTTATEQSKDSQWLRSKWRVGLHDTEDMDSVLPEAWSRFTGKSMDSDDIGSGLSKTFEVEFGGMRSEIESVSYSSAMDAIQVEGSIFDSTRNQKVGNFSRSFSEEGVNHERLEIDSNKHNQGFGWQFLEHTEKNYQELGFSQVRLNASLSAGAYVWARMGYSFDGDYEAQRVTSMFERYYTAVYGESPRISPKQPWEIAAYTGPDGQRVGKQFLLSPELQRGVGGWFGVKNLDSKDPGYQVGQTYYNIRRTTKSGDFESIDGSFDDLWAATIWAGMTAGLKDSDTTRNVESAIAKAGFIPLTIREQYAAVAAALRVLRAQKGFDESKHSRWPKGHPLGGQFKPKEAETPADERVWQKAQHEKAAGLSKLDAGAIGEELAKKILGKMKNTEFHQADDSRNNAPIDVLGDHLAVEVKAGLASNAKDAWKWRATIGQPGKAEAELLKQMTPEQKKEHNAWKYQAILDRKAEFLEELSKASGRKLEGATMAFIISGDGKKADAFFIPGFHLQLRWSQYATDEYYVGTYEV